VQEAGQGDERRENGPAWLPVTFNLKTELDKFVRQAGDTLKRINEENIQNLFDKNVVFGTFPFFW
jgi:hypothetical protein